MSDVYVDVDRIDQPRAVTVRLSDVKPEAVRWLWPEKIALGKVSLIAGDPGLGKSLLTSDFAARVSVGGHWPVDNSLCPQGDVVILSAEDDAADTIRPRLDAACADVSRIYQLTAVRDTQNGQEHCFSIERDIEALDKLLSTLPTPKLVIIDPISAYMGGTDSHKNSDVRVALAPLAALASKHRVAVVVVTHLNKSAQANALYRTTGSLAFIAAARAVFAVTKDKDDPGRRLVVPVKNNLGNDHTGLAYSIVTAENGAPVVGWEPDPVEISADEALERTNDDERSKREDAAAWLRDILSTGPVLTTELQKMARKEGHAWRTLGRARDQIGAEAHKQDFVGKWEWRMKPKVSMNTEGVQSKDVDKLRVAGHVGNDSPTKDATQHEGCPVKTVASLGDVGNLREDSGAAKIATTPQDCHINDVDNFGNSGTLGSDTGITEELRNAAAIACRGLQLTPTELIAAAAPGDYHDIVNSPETARAFAESLNTGRRLNS